MNIFDIIQQKAQEFYKGIQPKQQQAPQQKPTFPISQPQHFNLGFLSTKYKALQLPNPRFDMPQFSLDSIKQRLNDFVDYAGKEKQTLFDKPAQEVHNILFHQPISKTDQQLQDFIGQKIQPAMPYIQQVKKAITPTVDWTGKQLGNTEVPLIPGLKLRSISSAINPESPASKFFEGKVEDTDWKGTLKTALKPYSADATPEDRTMAVFGTVNPIKINASKAFQSTKNILDEAQYLKNPKVQTGQSIGEMTKNVKDWGNYLTNFVRTPDRVLNKIGMGKEAKLLRTQYDKYLQELPVEINRVTEWSKRAPNENQAIFQWLDGNKGVTLSPEGKQVATEIKAYLSNWADRLKLPKDKQISNYITHIFEKGKIEKDFDPDLARLINKSVAKSVYDPFLEKRLGRPDYMQDTWQALDAYVKRATRKVNMDEALEVVSAKAKDLDNVSYNYVKNYISRINMRPTEIDNVIDDFIKSSPIGYSQGSRPVTAITQKARQMVYRGLIGLNPLTALRNIQQSTNTYATLGEKNFLKGAIKTVQNLPKYITNQPTELERVGVLGHDIVQDRTLNATKKFWENMDKGLFYIFNFTEKFNRSIAYFGAKAQAISKGMNEAEAIDFAKGIVRKTQFDYSIIDTPALLQSDLMKTMFQFQTYTVKQTEFMAEMLKDKNVLGSIRWVASNLLFIGTVGKILGLDPMDMFPQFRFGVPPTLQLPYGIGEAAFQTKDKFGNDLTLSERILNPDLTKGAMNYVPGGGQILKTTEGIQSIQQGGSYTGSGKLRYPVEGGIAPVLFGSKNSPQAQEYYNNGSPLSDNETLLYKALLESGMTPQEAYTTIQGNKTESPEAFQKRVQEEAEPKNLIDHITTFVSDFFGKKEDKQAVSESDNPLIKAFKDEAAQDEKASKIKKIFELNLSKEKTEQMLENEGLGSFEEASLTIMKSLGVENGNRGKYIMGLIKDLDSDTSYRTMMYLMENEVLTTAVVSKWLDDGEINQDQAEALNDMIKMTKGTYKAPKAKKPHQVSIKRMTAPSIPNVNITVPKIKSAYEQAKTLHITKPKTSYKPKVRDYYGQSL